MSSGAVCKTCGGTEVDEDLAQGNAVCTNCGSVLEENVIVTDVSFQETGGGGTALVGQFVSSDGPQKSGIGGPQGYVARESREVTFNNGRKKISEVAGQLGMNQRCIDVAFNFFKMAVGRGLTRGRKSTHTIAACLYLASRTNNTPHMLLDFSDVLQVNIFELGKVFNFLAKSLYINPPPTDPCVYVMRFAQCLHFGDKEHEVCELALRLVKRMKRDWISFGRRPTGLCGAALLLASRYHSFNRTLTDIVRVVNIGEGVVRKRLEEFSQTPSGSLTLDDFASVDLESAEDPPSFQDAKTIQAKQMELELKAESLQDDLLVEWKKVDDALDEKKTKDPRLRPYLLPVGDSTVPELQMSSEFLQEDLLRNVINKTEDDAPQDTASLSMEEKMEVLRPTLESLGIKKGEDGRVVVEESEEGGGEGEGDESGELDLTGIDDEEIERYLLTPQESQMKTKIWMQNNYKFLQEREEKRAKRALEEEEASKKQQRKPPRKKRAPPIHASTAQEAMGMVVQEKKLSNKIDWEVLASLTEGTSGNSLPTPSTSNTTSNPPPPTPNRGSEGKLSEPKTEETDAKRRKVEVEVNKAKTESKRPPKPKQNKAVGGVGKRGQRSKHLPSFTPKNQKTDGEELPNTTTVIIA